jgi:dinuclear metal center YbgI/SA1388 family protein
MPTISDVAGALEAWAPSGSAQDYDNVGLQVGDASRPVERGLVALDMTPGVLEEASHTGADLVVTHHPLLFRPLGALTAGGGFPNALALRLAEAGVALYAAHTNLDAAPGGVSFALAGQLGLADVGFLGPTEGALRKLVVFVPEGHARRVHRAMAEAGGGQIGDYEACAFEGTGTGFFRPGEGADPFTDTPAGELEEAREVRLEVQAEQWHLPAVRAAMTEAHPYEEVAHDVYPVEGATGNAGLGAVGTLPAPEPLSAFLERTADALDARSLRYAGPDPEEARVERVAVCGGAGSDFVGKAQAAGADAYVTADVTYHEFFEVLSAEDGYAQMAFIDAGHYETEAVTERLLRDFLAEHFPEADWRVTEERTGPVRTFVPGA